MRVQKKPFTDVETVGERKGMNTFSSESRAQSRPDLLRLESE